MIDFEKRLRERWADVAATIGRKTFGDLVREAAAVGAEMRSEECRQIIVQEVKSNRDCSAANRRILALEGLDMIRSAKGKSGGGK